MTNGRAAKARHKCDQRLIDERNALLDVLNGILLKAGGVLVVEHEHYLGKNRHPVITLPMPDGVIVKLDDKATLVGDGKALIVVPTAVI